MDLISIALQGKHNTCTLTHALKTMCSSRLSCLFAPLCAQAGWDSSVWKYVPHALKGIKPVTNEPWARDEAVYNESRNSVDTRGSGEFAATEHFSFTEGDEDDEGGPQWDVSKGPPQGAMRVYDA